MRLVGYLVRNKYCKRNATWSSDVIEEVENFKIKVN